MSPGKLQQELKKRQPFQSLEQEAILNLARTNDQVQILFERLFRSFDELTPSQYNILRILRGEGAPMQILEIAERTITVVPGITGLIDRLERKGLVERERSTSDRRVIFVRITDKALALLARIDAPLGQMHHDVIANLSQVEMMELIRLLEKIRENCAPKL
jgi:MarR family transcriptional regulator, 2-MHQ and catechol-resistance regulon repressor